MSKLRDSEKWEQEPEGASRQLMQGWQVHDLAELGRVIKRFRKSQGLAINDAAALSSVSQDSYSRLERASGGIGTDRLLAILDGLGLEMQLVDKSSGMPSATNELIKRFTR